MFELPELIVLARQINENLAGSTVRQGRLGNSPHKFVWYNRKPGEFEKLTRGNAIAQDIMFRAKLHPKRRLDDVSKGEQRSLYRAILKTVQQAITLGGRYDERDLLGAPGKYVRLMDSRSEGRPCPSCRASIEKIQYLGGSCYLCPRCQT